VNLEAVSSVQVRDVSTERVSDRQTWSKAGEFVVVRGIAAQVIARCSGERKSELVIVRRVAQQDVADGVQDQKAANEPRHQFRTVTLVRFSKRIPTGRLPKIERPPQSSVTLSVVITTSPSWFSVRVVSVDMYMVPNLFA
jgi:hypothetical protein